MGKRVLIVCSAFVMMLTACNANKAENEAYLNEDDVPNNIEIQYEKNYSDGTPILDFDTRYENIKNTYPDKKILIWASNENVRYEEEVNKYLNDNKAEYVICFKNICDDKEMYDENGWITSYSEIFEKEINDDMTIDIVSTCYAYSQYDAFFNTYHHFVDQHWLEPLNDYLTNNSIGQKLLNFYPQNFWDAMEYKGEIWGIDGSLTCLGFTAGYKINADLYDKLTLTAKDLEGNYVDTLDTIYKICAENNMMFSTGLLNSMSMYTPYDFITSCVYINEQGKAENIYQNADTSELFDLVGDAYNNGTNINIYNTSVDELDSYFGESTYATCGKYTNDQIRTNEYFGLTSYDDNCEAYKIYPKSYNIIHAPMTAVGICSFSDNKELAFEALVQLMTNEKLNNIMCYGIDYEVVDGCITTNGYYNTMNVENKLSRLPFSGLEYSDMHKRFKAALNDFDVSEYAGFSFDGSKVKQQIIDTEKVLSLIDMEYPSDQYNSGEEYLTILNERLCDAGLQDIIDEANRQLEVYNNEKNS